MTTETPPQDPPTDVLRVPCPTHPVAGREINSDTPAFDWTPIPDATHYRLQLAPSEEFDPLYYDETTERRASVSLSSLLPDDGTIVYWRVRAERADDAVSGWSQPACFRRAGTRTANGDTAVRVDAAPRPVDPREAGGRPVDASALQFSWEDIPEASGYEIQVARSADFDDPLADVTVDRRTSVNLYDALPSDDAALCWRIRALFPVAAPGPWSEATAFRTSAAGGAASRPHASDDPGTHARAKGPVLNGQTSSRLTFVVGLVVVLSFVATIALIAFAS